MTPQHTHAQEIGIAVTISWIAIWLLIARAERKRQRRAANSFRESARRQFSQQQQREKPPDEAA